MIRKSTVDDMPIENVTIVDHYWTKILWIHEKYYVHYSQSRHEGIFGIIIVTVIPKETFANNLTITVERAALSEETIITLPRLGCIVMA